MGSVVWLSWGTRKETQFTYSETLQTGRSVLAFWTHQTLQEEEKGEKNNRDWVRKRPYKDRGRALEPRVTWSHQELRILP